MNIESRLTTEVTFKDMMANDKLGSPCASFFSFLQFTDFFAKFSLNSTHRKRKKKS